VSDVATETETPVTPAPKVTPAPAKTPKELAVPMARFERVNGERRALKDENTVLKTQIESLTTEKTTLAEKVTAAEAAAARVAQLEEDLGLTRAGFDDPDSVEQLRLHYGKLPEDDRKKTTIVDYAKALKVEGAAIPKSLQPFLAPPADTTKRTPTPPRDPGSDGAPPPSTATYSNEGLKVLREKAQKSGAAADWLAVNDYADKLAAQSRKKKP
jgi:hypothetical protein